MNTQIYPKQLMIDLGKKLPKPIIQFVINPEYYDAFLTFTNLESLIEYILATSFMPSYSRADYMSLKAAKTRVRLNTRARWHKKIIDNMKRDFSDPKNPFYQSWLIHSMVKEEEWMKLYNCNFDTFVENKLADVESWRTTEKGLLITFPFLSYVSKKTLHTAILNDTIIAICDIILDEYGGTLAGFFRNYPEFFVDKPLFTPVGHNMRLILENNELTDIYYPVENSPEYLKTTIGVLPDETNVVKMRALDETDLHIINFCLSKIDNTFYQDHTVIVNLAELSKEIYGKSSGQHLNILLNRCIKLTNIRQEEENNYSFNYFDNVFRIKESNMVSITFGTVLYSSVVDHRLIQVTAENYEALTNKLSRIIYYSLQMERVRISSPFFENQEEYSKQTLVFDTDISFFERRVRFKTKSRRENIKLLKDALQEFCDQKIAIKTFTVKDIYFNITFYPLSPEEIEDLQFTRKYNSIEEI